MDISSSQEKQNSLRRVTSWWIYKRLSRRVNSCQHNNNTIDDVDRVVQRYNIKETKWCSESKEIQQYSRIEVLHCKTLHLASQACCQASAADSLSVAIPITLKRCTEVQWYSCKMVQRYIGSLSSRFSVCCYSNHSEKVLRLWEELVTIPRGWFSHLSTFWENRKQKEWYFCSFKKILVVIPRDISEFLS